MDKYTHFTSSMHDPEDANCRDVDGQFCSIDILGYYPEVGTRPEVSIILVNRDSLLFLARLRHAVDQAIKWHLQKE